MTEYLMTLRRKMRAAVTEVNKASARFKYVDGELVDKANGNEANLIILRRDSRSRQDAINAWDHGCSEVIMWAGVINAEVALMQLEDALPVSQ